MVKRKGTRNIHTFPDSEKVVTMIEHKGFVFVATERCIYQIIDGELNRIKMVKEKA